MQTCTQTYNHTNIHKDVHTNKQTNKSCYKTTTASHAGPALTLVGIGGRKSGNGVTDRNESRDVE